ncbi:MAG: CoA transferase subunit A [Lachnospiraceae bacterium]|jgi:acetate CoA/acetoacetate CoA-transferase alpha subunit|nr:CoA transferase subunit A [Lachnospiraceae bacterium]
MSGKLTTAAEAANLVKDGMTVMIGGFMAVGTPEILVDALVAKGVKHLTVIGNDAGLNGKGIIKLVEAGAVDELIVSHIGMTPVVGKLMGEGTLKVTLVPQGSLAEKVRAGGAGLGGVLTPTGLGTEVAAGKDVVTVDGKDYLLEKPLHADVALIRGSLVDEDGNVIYKGTTRNFNPLMATAADTVIVAAQEVVKVGALDKEAIATPGIFVDYIVSGEK